jgi:hypothetical protein
MPFSSTRAMRPFHCSCRIAADIVIARSTGRDGSSCRTASRIGGINAAGPPPAWTMSATVGGGADRNGR